MYYLKGFMLSYFHFGLTENWGVHVSRTLSGSSCVPKRKTHMPAS